MLELIAQYKKLDGKMTIWQNDDMAKWILRASSDKGSFRITLPKKVVEGRGWGGLKYVILEDGPGEKIILRGFDDGTECNRGSKRS